MNNQQEQFLIDDKMLFRTKQKSHEQSMRKLERKLKIAKMKREERELKNEILKLYLPFHFNLKFNKLIVILSIVAVTSYTVAAILLQKCTTTELSPTLTTCVYAFFGTELLGLASIKICDTRFTSQENNINYNDIDSSQISGEEIIN